ncbi:hypothetical protein FHS40_000592 [Streptomyces spectabilis]|uniref:Uncharacterized protein n=1 Tax=Streptomyces spectabilis TaxID=68270 RepID=A0A7W8AN78_STRST|nr:hypothetical protein [Streptomyces spectabilis]
MVQQLVQHRCHYDHFADALAVHDGQGRGGVEVLQQDDGVAAQGAGQERGVATGVRHQRAYQHRRVGRRVGRVRLGNPQAVVVVAAAVHDQLGQAGRAARVEQGCQVAAVGSLVERESARAGCCCEEVGGNR